MPVGQAAQSAPALSEQLMGAARAFEARVLLRQDIPFQLDPAEQSLWYGACRHWGPTRAVLSVLCDREPASVLMALLAVAGAAAQTQHRPWPILVDEAVEAARRLGAEPAGAPWAGFCNAVLRRFPQALSDWHARHQVRETLPRWWCKAMQQGLAQDPIDDWLAAYQTHPPLTLRLMVRGEAADARIAAWEALGHRSDRDPLRTEQLSLWPPATVSLLPGYAEGDFRVQDQSAQRLLEWFRPPPGSVVLDACAAPGGKSFLLAELPGLTIWAADADASRLARLAPEQRRLASHLQSHIQTVHADLSQPEWPSALPAQFDAIVLDAPCTGSGVARRHPEILWRRTPEQLQETVRLQAKLLDQAWARLRPGGQLAYITCSVFHAEGEGQVVAFMSRQSNVTRLPAPGLIAVQPPKPGPQGQLSPDGFFCASLLKSGV